MPNSGTDLTLADIPSFPLHLDVPTAGKLAFGLGRTASYAAAKRGDLPTLKVGGRIIVPTARLLAVLGVDR